MRTLLSEEAVKRIGMAMFYISITLELLIVIIDKSNYTNPIEGQLFRVTFLFAAVKLLLTRYSMKEWIGILLFCLLGFVSYRLTGRNEILRIVVFVAACKGMQMHSVLKYVFFFTLAGCLLLAGLSVTGIYGRLYLEADFGRGYEQIRYCLGLGHPNALHCMFFMLVLLWIYLYHNKLNWYHYLLLFLLNHGLYLLTDSNTGMLMTFCGIAGGLLFRYVRPLGGNKWVYFAGTAVILFCVVFSVLAATPSFARPSDFWFKNPFISAVGSQLNGRIQDLYYGSIRGEGTIPTWSLFSVPENHYYFDMGFVRLFYWYGVIPGLVYIWMNLLLIREFYRKKDSAGLVMMCALSVYTVVEAHIISVYIGRNYLLFIIGMYVSDMLSLSDDRQEYGWHIYRFLRETKGIGGKRMVRR